MGYAGVGNPASLRPDQSVLVWSKHCRNWCAGTIINLKKEDDDQIDYKKLMRKETKVERLQRQREEKAQMNQREKIERDIICTDPADYLNKLTETKKIELHMVNEAFVRSSRRNSKACSTTKNSGKRRVETTSEQ